MKVEVKHVELLDDGKYDAEITKTEVIGRTKEGRQFSYYDITLGNIEKHPNVTLRYGVPFTVSNRSELGKILEVFGGNIQTATEIDPDEILRGQKVSMMVEKTKTKGRDGREFDVNRILSIKPRK